MSEVYHSRKYYYRGAQQRNYATARFFRLCIAVPPSRVRLPVFCVIYASLFIVYHALYSLTDRVENCAAAKKIGAAVNK